MGVAAFIMPLLVATSALGSLSCHIMTSSRLCFVGARQGHFPDCLSLITVDKNLPKPSLIFLVRLKQSSIQLTNKILKSFLDLGLK